MCQSSKAITEPTALSRVVGFYSLERRRIFKAFIGSPSQFTYLDVPQWICQLQNKHIT